MAPRIIIITGPTASGKTDFSEVLAQQINGVIINADMGQFYTPLTIGTAKPDWKNKPFSCMLFDILDKPVELNSARYREKVLQAIASIVEEGKIPIVVGGSLFYIKSLFFPPKAQEVVAPGQAIDLTQATDVLWNMLKSIDEERAMQLHHNDRYRIVRALKIWQQTGVKPSQQKPVFAPVFAALFISIEPARDVLRHRIEQRTQAMLQHGLIEEAETLINTDWEPFLEKKGLIGYREIFTWLRAGKQEFLNNAMKDRIVQKTWQYAKRQVTFLTTFKRDLFVAGEQAPGSIQILTLSHGTVTPEIVNSVRNFVQKDYI